MELKLTDLVTNETINLERERTYVLGRHRDNSIPIPSIKSRGNLSAAQRELAMTVSNYHAELDIRGESVKIRDRKSSNGTYLVKDGKQEEERVTADWCEVQPGTIIKLGHDYSLLLS